MTTSQQDRPSTPQEDIKVLYGRVAKLNDAVAALLTPAWGSETGILPSDHPLYVGEKKAATKEEQGAPTDWQAIAKQRERELKTVGEARHRAEQQRDRLAATLDEVIRHFVHKGHPGEPCLQTGWISEKTVARWRDVAYPPQPAAHDAGPSVREAAAADRAYWERRDAGEGA